MIEQVQPMEPAPDPVLSDSVSEWLPAAVKAEISPVESVPALQTKVGAAWVALWVSFKSTSAKLESRRVTGELCDDP